MKCRLYIVHLLFSLSSISTVSGLKPVSVKLPSYTLPYQYVLYGFEAGFWTICVLVNLTFLSVLRRASAIHRNMRVLIGHMIVVYCVVGVCRIVMLYNHIQQQNGFSEAFMAVFGILMRVAMTAKTASEITLVVERIMATKYADRYEKNVDYRVTIGLVLVCYCYPAITMPLSLLSLGPVVFMPVPIVFDVVSWTFAYILFKINKSNFYGTLGDLSTRYQTAENIKMLRTIFWFLVYSTTSNAITVSIYAFYVFYINENERDDLYAAHDAVWYFLNSVSAALLPLPFIAKNDALRKSFNCRSLLGRKGQVGIQKQVKGVSGRVLVNKNDHAAHFKDLKSMWGDC